ncbi:MAG: hypothetical protein ACRD3V_26810 [Vicinamibacteria bacterium]
MRRRASSPKLQVLNTALMSAQGGTRFEDVRADRESWGRLVESAAGAHLAAAATTRTPDSPRSRMRSNRPGSSSSAGTGSPWRSFCWSRSPTGSRHENERTTRRDAVRTTLDVREHLVEALKLDLVGPWAGHPLAEERLQGWVRPSN